VKTIYTPWFLEICGWDDNHPENCETCPYKTPCEEFFKPLSVALEKYFTVGEI